MLKINYILNQSKDYVIIEHNEVINQHTKKDILDNLKLSFPKVKTYNFRLVKVVGI